MLSARGKTETKCVSHCTAAPLSAPGNSRLLRDRARGANIKSLHRHVVDVTDFYIFYHSSFTFEVNILSCACQFLFASDLVFDLYHNRIIRYMLTI